MLTRPKIRHAHALRTYVARACGTRQLTRVQRSALRLCVSIINLLMLKLTVCKEMFMLEIINIAQLQPHAGCALAARSRARAP